MHQKFAGVFQTQYGDFNHCFVVGSRSLSASFHSSLIIFALASERGVILHSYGSGMQTKPCVSFSWSGRIGLPLPSSFGEILKPHNNLDIPRKRLRSATCIPGQIRLPAPKKMGKMVSMFQTQASCSRLGETRHGNHVAESPFCPSILRTEGEHITLGSIGIGRRVVEA